jgi:hypothetical protein
MCAANIRLILEERESFGVNGSFGTDATHKILYLVLRKNRYIGDIEVSEKVRRVLLDRTRGRACFD